MTAAIEDMGPLRMGNWRRRWGGGGRRDGKEKPSEWDEGLCLSDAIANVEDWMDRVGMSKSQFFRGCCSSWRLGM